MVDATKIDRKRELKELYSARAGEPRLVDVPELSYLTVSGIGEPGGEPFRQAIDALYTMSYTLKFLLKRSAQGLDFVVMPLQALWGGDPADFPAGRRSAWEWTLMILQPDQMTGDLVERAREDAAKKKDLPALANLCLERLREGTVVQILHVGPYDTERATIEHLHAFMAERGLAFAGRHHEIYLSDPSRTAPGKLRTILRQPVRPS
jgi:hypothetical protein